MPTDTPTEPDVETPESPAPDAQPDFEHLPDDHPLVKTLKTLREELKAAKGDAATAAEKAKKWDDAEAANLSELEKAQARIAELERAATDSEMKALRANIAAETGVPAALLTGADEDGLRASAEALLAFKGTAPKAPASEGQGKVGTPIGGPVQITASELSSMSTAEINQARREGRLDHILGKS